MAVLPQFIVRGLLLLIVMFILRLATVTLAVVVLFNASVTVTVTDALEEPKINIGLAVVPFTKLPELVAHWYVNGVLAEP